MPTKKILPLSQDIIAKIAAGEVIERPVYAVKELIENALDAHADAIAIHIEESGLRRIMVVDNGEGMSKEDLQESFKLHTTSKIKTEDELTHITTLGFRGEALASIAAISQMLIRSRTKKSVAGAQIELKNGKIENVVPVGMPQGTNVTVTNLFHSVPGRKKFLKSLQTEFRHIVQLVTTMAMSHPNVHVTLTHNKKTVFDLPKSTDVLERIKQLLGTKLFANLLPVYYQDNYITISGFIGKPQEKTFSTSKQMLFVNKRKVSDKLISLAVKDAYGTLIDPKSLPVFVLFISLPYEFVDVNVHPRKEFIRFADTQLLIDTVYKSVSQTLAKHNLTFSDQTGFGFGLKDAKLTQSFAGRILKENQIPWDIRPRNELGLFTDILQVHNLFLLTQTKFGIALIDQHAAHERILYEQFFEAFIKEHNQSPQYHLPKPFSLELSVTETELLREYSHILKNLGIDIELFQGNTFLIHAVPLIFQDRKPGELIMELLSDLEKNEKTKSVDEVSKKLVAYLACRAAVKAGESLTKKQAKDLVQKLELTNNNATCPHGRPTKIVIAIEHLNKMFKR